jgi:hypothetical protein
VEWRLARETEILGENPPQRHFVHHKFHLTRPGIEPWLLSFLSSYYYRNCYYCQRGCYVLPLALPLPSLLLLLLLLYLLLQLLVLLLLLLWDIATGYRLDIQGVGVRVPVGARIFTSPCCPDRLWGPPSLLSNGSRQLSCRDVKLTTHLQLVPRSRKRGSIHPLHAYAFMA